ncbi:hypothetical protein A0H81_10432 [Grifola frondosa]|uniref:Uncharacterized protein n=1 Tax=Grifola frondosa TaxID=5627 RepID=A0A1C7LY02_GRIFR|nr:hypothetical protein A0H81_10432 [Grifola frondosa]
MCHTRRHFHVPRDSYMLRLRFSHDPYALSATVSIPITTHDACTQRQSGHALGLSSDADFSFDGHVFLAVAGLHQTVPHDDIVMDPYTPISCSATPSHLAPASCSMYNWSLQIAHPARSPITALQATVQSMILNLTHRSTSGSFSWDRDLGVSGTQVGRHHSIDLPTNSLDTCRELSSLARQSLSVSADAWMSRHFLHGGCDDWSCATMLCWRTRGAIHRAVQTGLVLSVSTAAIAHRLHRTQTSSIPPKFHACHADVAVDDLTEAVQSSSAFGPGAFECLVFDFDGNSEAGEAREHMFTKHPQGARGGLVLCELWSGMTEACDVPAQTAISAKLDGPGFQVDLRQSEYSNPPKSRNRTLANPGQEYGAMMCRGGDDPKPSPQIEHRYLLPDTPTDRTAGPNFFSRDDDILVSLRKNPIVPFSIEADGSHPYATPIAEVASGR